MMNRHPKRPTNTGCGLWMSCPGGSTGMFNLSKNYGTYGADQDNPLDLSPIRQHKIQTATSTTAVCSIVPPSLSTRPMKLFL